MTQEWNLGPGHIVQPKPKRSKIWLWILLGMLVLCGGGSALAVATIGGAAAVVEKSATDRAEDVTITSCKVTQDLFVEVGYTIKPHANGSQVYFPQFNITDSTGAIIGTAADITTNLPSGSTYKGKAMGNITPVQGKITCVLAEA